MTQLLDLSKCSWDKWHHTPTTSLFNAKSKLEYLHVHKFDRVRYYLFLQNQDKQTCCIDIGTGSKSIFIPHSKSIWIKDTCAMSSETLCNNKQYFSLEAQSIGRDICMCNEYYWNRHTKRIVKYNVQGERVFDYTVGFLDSNILVNALVQEEEKGVLLVAVYHDNNNNKTTFLTRYVADTLFIITNKKPYYKDICIEYR
jgi:hypothetical protein